MMKTKEKKPRAKVPSTTAVRRLKVRLEALVAAPGTPDEGKVATVKLGRLLEKYDFTVNKEDREGIFCGSFEAASDARPVKRFEDWTLASYVQWAIQESTAIECVFRGSDLLANATPKTADKLAGIAAVISDGFCSLWDRFQTFPGAISTDRSLFWRGLYDGMMSQQKPQGEPLPQRATIKTRGRIKKAALGHVAGLSLHPYQVAVDLGKQIRFSVPIQEVNNQLEAMRPKEIAA